MGTTLDALQSGSGRFGFSLIIQGFPYILTDAADVSAVVTAYAGTEWEDALPGLKVIGGIKQSIEPFKEDLDVPTLTFHVMDCYGQDIFGKAVWKSKPSIHSRLNDVFQPAADGSGTLTVRDNATGPAAFPSDGVVYVGTRAVRYSAKATSTTFTVDAGGASAYSPFLTSTASGFTVPGSLAEGQNWDVAAPPKVADIPLTWKGKQVALYLHRIVGGVWDEISEAHREFAGTIAELSDGEGITVVTCDDIRKQVEDAVLLRKQFTGYVKEGIHLRAGDGFTVTYWDDSVGYEESSEFLVVESGASGVAECNEGLYSYGEFLGMLNDWIAAESLTGEYTFRLEHGAKGYRTSLVGSYGDTKTREIRLLANGIHHAGYDTLEFMGFEPFPRHQAGYQVTSGSDYTSKLAVVSTYAPYRARAVTVRPTGKRIVEFDSTDGRFFNGNGYYPQFLEEKADGEDNWSFFQVGDQLLAGEYDSGNLQIKNVYVLRDEHEAFKGSERTRAIRAAGITYDDAEKVLAVRQVIGLEGKFSEVLPALFASVPGGAAGVNHPDYDVFDFGAGIPWSLLDEDFVNSCESLETTGETDTISILLRKPTKLKDILIPEMALRFAFLVYKEGNLRFVSPQMPNALTCDWTLNETNKAVGAGEDVPMTSCQWTSDYLTNSVKVNYQRLGREQPLEIIDSVSVSMHGQTESIEIDALNSSSDDVEALASEVSARIFPMFARPVKLVTRTIAPTLYGICPGDTVSLSDDLVRDPTTGARGISNRACICISSFHDYGHDGGQLTGEVTLLMTDEDRAYPLAPAVEVDTTYTSGLYTNGYDSTNFRLRLKNYSFGTSSRGLDSGNFNNSDPVRIVEMDPADPSSIDAWSRTIDSTAGIGLTYMQLTAGISSPSWSGATKKFVVIPQAYTSSSATQKLHAYQADDGDGHIQDTAEPNSYGTSSELGFSRGVATDLPALLADELYGDGKPLTPFQLQYLTRMVNNLISYKTAPHTPILTVDSAATTASASWRTIWMGYVNVGGIQVSGRTRKLSVAPRFRSTTAGQTAYVRVTSSSGPPSGSSGADVTFPPGFRQVTFTTTSATSVVATAQDLLPIKSSVPRHTFITVEIKATSGHEVRFVGLPTFYLKPLT